MMNAQLTTRDDQLEADYDWLADYMAGRLTDAREQEFEQRLIDDPEFFRMMAPFLTVLLPIEPSPIEIEVRERVAARRAAQQRAMQEREARRRHIKGWIAAITTAAVPVKVIAGFATATLIYAVVRLERPSVVTPTPIFVQVPTVPKQPSTQPDTQSLSTHPRPTVVATNPTDIDVVPVFSVTVDSTTERALAEMLANSPLPTPQFTPTAAKVPAQRARNWRQVAVIQVDTAGGSGLKQFMDGLAHGVKRAVGAVAGTIADIAHRRRPVHQLGPRGDRP
jgi:hypothetical protein